MLIALFTALACLSRIYYVHVNFISFLSTQFPPAQMRARVVHQLRQTDMQTESPFSAIRLYTIFSFFYMYFSGVDLVLSVSTGCQYVRSKLHLLLVLGLYCCFSTDCKSTEPTVWLVCGSVR